MKKVKFDVTGMTCSSCSSHVDKAVRKLDGVKDVNVNLLSNNMIVEYDEQVVNDDKIIKAVVEDKLNNDSSLYYKTLRDFRTKKKVTFKDSLLQSKYDDYIDNQIKNSNASSTNTEQ